MNDRQEASRIRINIILEREDDPLVFEQLRPLKKGPRRTARLKRMLHVAALIQSRLIPMPSTQQPTLRPTALNPDNHAAIHDADIAAIFGSTPNRSSIDPP